MTNDIERHSSDEWRKTAAALMPESSSAGAEESAAAAKVNANGAPLLGDSRDLFRPKTSDIPAKPGVYKWRDGEGRVIYVGKAKNLRNRLTNYFQPLYLLHPRTQTMVLTARSLEWTVVATELESLTLEYTWIKEFDPRFNVQFRDDKTYPYLAVSTGERVPRVWVTRSRKRRDTRYFGPYAKVWELRHSLDRLLRTFPVRTCTTNVFHKAQLTGRPCLLASIGKCSAPCVNQIEADEHRRLCEQLVGVMTGRLGRPYIAQLTRDMKEASAELEFEKAARLRDQIQMLETVVQQNAVVFDQDVDADVFGFANDELEASVHAFYVRAGSIRGERNWSVERVEDIADTDLMADLLVQVYSDEAGNDHPQSAAPTAPAGGDDISATIPAPDPDSIVLFGDSAGGNLAAAVSLMARDRGEFMPRTQMLLYPVVGNDYNPETSPFESVRTNGTDYILTAQDMADYIDMYRSSVADLTNPYFAPLTAHDLSNQPRTLVLSAEYCPLRDEDEAYARRLQLVNDNVSCYRIHDGIHGYLLNTSAVGLVATTYRIIEHFLDDTPLEPAPGTGTTANAPEGGDAWQDVLGTD